MCSSDLTADEVDTAGDQVAGQFRWRRTEAAQHGVDDGVDRLLDRLPHLLGGEDHRTGQAAGQFPAPDLGRGLVGDGVGGADGDLDGLGRPLADGDAVGPADVGADGGIEIEAADPDGLDFTRVAEFLFGLRDKYPSAIFCGFGLTYDINCWLASEGLQWIADNLLDRPNGKVCYIKTMRR